MHATVLVEKIGPRKYRASTTQPVVLESEGATQRQAVERLTTLAQKRLAEGQLVQITLPGPETNPWTAFAGIWKDHPEFPTFLSDIAAYRRSSRSMDAAS